MVIVKLNDGSYQKITLEQKSRLDNDGILFLGKRNDARNIQNRILRIVVKNDGINSGMLFNRIRCDRGVFDAELIRMIESGILIATESIHKYNKSIVKNLSIGVVVDSNV